ncbi:MAG: leucine-rich repeat domain-containing protein, partial [Clostridia bacterium]|nr:leucine-rich repeat domain-containing protein [Clostridia bacterium]
LTGKTFSFWSISPDSPTQFSFSTAITGDITLYAQWDSSGTSVMTLSVNEFLAATDFGTTSSEASPYKIKLTDVTDSNISQLKAKIKGNATSGDMENVYITLDLSECTGLTSLPTDAFDGLAARWNTNSTATEKHRGSLVAITLPPTITSIGKYAFFQSDLKTINIPEGVTSIADDAFNQARLTGELRLPSTLASVGTRAFYMTRLTKVYAPEGLDLSNARLSCTVEYY